MQSTLAKAAEMLSEALQAYKSLHRRLPSRVKASRSIFCELLKGAVGNIDSIDDTLYTPNGWNIILDKKLNGNQVICE